MLHSRVKPTMKISHPILSHPILSYPALNPPYQSPPPPPPFSLTVYSPSLPLPIPSVCLSHDNIQSVRLTPPTLPPFLAACCLINEATWRTGRTDG